MSDKKKWPPKVGQNIWLRGSEIGMSEYECGCKICRLVETRKPFEAHIFAIDGAQLTLRVLPYPERTWLRLSSIELVVNP